MKLLAVCFFLLFVSTDSFAQKVKLELHLKKGNTYYHTLDGNSKIKQIVDGKEINIEAGLGGTVSYEIIDELDTSYSTKVRYNSLHMKMGIQGKSIEFRSDSKDNNDKASKVLAQLINAPFSVEMSKRGELTKVENIDKIFRNMMDTLSDLTESQKQKMMEAMLKGYGEEAFKGNFNMLTAMFPAGKVKKGDKWVMKIRLELMQAAELETTYQLTEIGDDYYQIHGESTINNVDKETYVPVNGLPVKYDLSGTMITDLKISKKTGWVIDGTIKQEMKGNMEFKDTEQVPGGMIVPFTYVNDIKVSGS